MAETVVRSRPARATPAAELRAAVGFLTRVPAGARVGDEAPTGAAAFPLVGAALGAVASIPLLVIGGGHAPIAGLVAVALVAVLDGGLHLDGLSDTIDALAAPPDRAERARTDPRAGSAGVAAIALVLGLEVAALSDLVVRDATAGVAALVIAGSLSRASAPLLAVLAGRRLAPAAGLGRWFAERVHPVHALLALAVGAAPVLAAAGAGLPRLAAGAIAGLLVGAAVVGGVARARHQLDGDAYGFAIEATFAFVLAGCAVAG